MNYGAYVMVKTSADLTKQVFGKLATTPGVKNFHPVTGRYDAVIYVEGDNHEKVTDTILNQIRTTKGVITTETYWCLPATTWKQAT